MKKILSDNKIRDRILVIEGLLIILLCVLTIHDTGTATGAGYLMFLKTGLFSRSGWDLVIDVWVLGIVCLFILIPSMKLKSSLSDASLFFMMGVSIIHLVRPDKLLIFVRMPEIQREEVIRALIEYLPEWILLLFVLYMIYSFSGSDQKDVDRAEICVCISILFMFAGVIFPPVYELSLFASGYVLLIPLLAKITGRKECERLLLGTLLLLRCIWRLYMIMAQYHM